MQWGFSVQRELPGNWLVEAGYMGNEASTCRAAEHSTYLPPQYRSLGTQLQQLVDNPYFGIIDPASALGSGR